MRLAGCHELKETEVSPENQRTSKGYKTKIRKRLTWSGNKIMSINSIINSIYGYVGGIQV